MVKCQSKVGQLTLEKIDYTLKCEYNHSMDNAVINFMMQHMHGSKFVNYLMKFITYLGEYGLIWVVLLIVLICIPKTRKIGIIATICLLVELVLCNGTLKPLIARERPFAKNTAILDFLHSIGLKIPKDGSFPSGHTASSFAVAVSLMLLTGKKAWGALVLAFLIAFSRVFLCVHYLTDVLGGMILGTSVALVVCLIYKTKQKSKSTKTETSQTTTE